MGFVLLKIIQESGPMGKYIKRKNLTPTQYKMANKTMVMILTLCYLLFITVENARLAERPHGLFRMIIYAVFIVLNVVVVKIKGDKRLQC